MIKIETRIKQCRKFYIALTIVFAVIFANLAMVITAEKANADASNCNAASNSICSDGNGHNYADKIIKPPLP